jgi:hypothetical protein
LSRKKNVYYYIILSIFAGVFILIISLFYEKNDFSIYDKIFVVLLFILICLFGLSLSLYPRWYKKFKIDRNIINVDKKNNKIIRNRIGHHPDCIYFKKHTLKIKNKTICAGCTGLALGSIISIILICFYLYLNVIYSELYNLFLIIGLIFVFQIFLEIMIPKRNVIIHTISNILHVLGFFLITVSILEITGNIIYTSIVIFISFLFLETRIHLSLYNHSLICKKCKKDCKMY